MADKKTQQMSNEERLKNEKTLRMSIHLLATSCLLMLLAGVYLVIAKGGKFNAFIVISITFFLIAALSSKSLKEIRKEKEIRGIWHTIRMQIELL